MLRYASRITVTTLGVVCVLAMATPVEAQKTKSSKRSRPAASRVSSRSAKSAPRVKFRTNNARSVKSARSASRRQFRSGSSSATRYKATSRSLGNTVRVNRATTKRSTFQSRQRPQSKRVIQGKSSRVTSKSRSQWQSRSKTTTAKPRSDWQSRSKTATAKGRTEWQSRSKDVATKPGSRWQSKAKQPTTTRGLSTFTKNRVGNANADADGYKDRFSRRPGDVAKDEYVNRFRSRPDNRRGVVDRRPHRRYRRYNDYRHGYYDGYRYGYYHGYHIGHRHGYYYPHRHYYGPHLVFGFHYGGFRFYRSHWHFVLVLGDPYVSHHNHYYRYNWWDGRPTTLVTWEQAVDAYPASYVFEPGTCVQLYIRTREERDYSINVDPRYWDAQDPGELYAALWAELEQTGQLQIEDINGAVHIFPAGMIQQIEARRCR